MPERIRVKDKDTGYSRTIPESQLPHGNYQVLKQDAVDPVTGDDVPPDFGSAAPTAPAPAAKKTVTRRRSAKKSTPSPATAEGREATNEKEKN